MRALAIAVICLVALVPSIHASCLNNCSFPLGTCLSPAWNACQCTDAAMGADCSFVATNGTSAVYTLEVENLVGTVLRQNWILIQNDSAYANQSVLRIRWTVNTYSWFGVVINPGWDGMTSGDSWIYWVEEASGKTFLYDYYSFDRNQPEMDGQQDLHLVNSWRDGVWQTVEFDRVLNTGDSRDAVFSLGDSVRLMWTTGLSPPSASQFSSSNRHEKLSKHGYVGNVAQFKIDFIAGTAVPLSDGITWPRGYYTALILGLSVLVLPFGLIMSQNFIKKSAFGRCMGKRICKCTFPASSGGCWASIGRWLGTDELTIQNWIFSILYIGINVAVVAMSLENYSEIGRSWMYVLGHLTAINLALQVLPASHNSPFLWLFNIGYDVAIAWHRRLGRVTIVLLLLHALSMLFLIWDFSVILYMDACYNGMGSFYGAVAGVCFLLVVVFSVSFIRRHAWEWFLYLHLILVVLGYIFALMHSYNLRWLMIVPGALALFDLLLRYTLNPVIRYGSPTRLCAIECFGDAKGTQVTSLTLETGSHRVKQPNAHVYLRIPRVAPFQLHPFSISSVEPIVNGNGTTERYRIQVHAMVRHDSSNSWTSRLFELASSYVPSFGPSRKIDFDSGDVDGAEDLARSAPFTVLLDGPFSSLDLPLFDYKVVVLVAGGIGATACMNLLNYYRRRHDQVPTLKVYFLWTSRTRVAFKSWFSDDLRQLQNLESQCIQMDFYDSGDILQLDEMDGKVDPNETRLRVSVGRPDFEEYLANVLATSMEQDLTCRDIAVFSCGPKAMIDDVEYQAERLGIQSTHEAFSY